MTATLQPSARLIGRGPELEVLYGLIDRMPERGCALVVRGEPGVCTPEDAFRCFMGTEMETLVVGNCVLRKPAQDPSLAKDYKGKFELD